MIVIGVDPGTATTGYGLVRENQDSSLSLVAYGVITTPAGLPMSKRLIELHRQLNEVLLLHRPQSAAVEKLFLANNVTTAITVGQARGVALLSLAQASLPVYEYTPMEVKQAVAGYGGAGKSQVQGMVKALLALDETPSPDDAADALAVAITHVNSVRMRSLAENERLA
jgi:crossover junction endodeoxyribonuclease RuvC